MNLGTAAEWQTRPKHRRQSAIRIHLFAAMLTAAILGCGGLAVTNAAMADDLSTTDSTTKSTATVDNSKAPKITPPRSLSTKNPF